MEIKVYKLFFLIIFIPTFCLAYEGGDKPYSVFGNDTEVLDIDHNEYWQGWQVWMILPDREIAKAYIMHNRIYIQDNSGKIIYESEIQINRCAMFATVDPKATEMPEFSPYTFCMGDPVNYVDADGMQPSVMEAALMAQYVYKDKETRDIALRALKDSKWVLSEFPTSIRMNYTGTFENGLQSVLFQRETNGKIEYAYVFAGTNSFEDVLEDFFQILGIAYQCDTAIYNARTLSKELGDRELTFVGHSLGGCNAAASSMATGRAAITFNPAAVSPLTKLYNNLGPASNVTNYRTSGVNVGLGNLEIGGCFVNNLQDNLGMNAPGTTYSLPIGNRNAFTSHGIDGIVDYLRSLGLSIS